MRSPGPAAPTRRPGSAVRRDGSGSVEIVIKGTRFTEAEAEAQVHGICFKTGPPEQVGVELEWLARDRRDPALPVQAEQVAAILAGFGLEGHLDGEGYQGQTAQIVRYEFPSLPSGASLTVEPGGQLELSSAPAATLGELLEVTGRDLAALRDAAAAVGLELCGYGLDPLRPPRRVLDLPRYAAMEEFFDRDGPWGRQMMCGTASVQVCLDAGDDGDEPVRLPLTLAAAARDRARAGGGVRQLPAAGRQADRLAFGPAAGVGQHGPGADPGSGLARGREGGRGGRRGPARRMGGLRAGRRAHVRPRTRVAGLDRAARGDLPRLAARRRYGIAAGADRGGPGLSPVHAVPAGPPARAHGAADDRRAARRRLDRARGRGDRAGRRRPGRRRRAGRRRAGVEQIAGRRGSVAACGHAAARPTR